MTDVASTGSASAPASDVARNASIERELQQLLERSQRLTKEMFLANYRTPISLDATSAALSARVKVSTEYAAAARALASASSSASAGATRPTPTATAAPASSSSSSSAAGSKQRVTVTDDKEDGETTDEKTTQPVFVAPGVALENVPKRRRVDAAGNSAYEQLLDALPTDQKHSGASASGSGSQSTALILAGSGASGSGSGGDSMALIATENMDARTALILKNRQREFVKPIWHAPWKLKTVVSGHTGWVRAIAVDASNEWFVTGAADRTIKIWDLASATLKLTLTGHINTIRGLAVSNRHPYLFSCAEDKKVLCWDLEYNKVIRSYHGHLSGVYALALHPTLDVLVSGGRDSTVRVWDMRTKSQIRSLSGHTNTVGSLQCQSVEPQIISGSHDSTLRLWDLATGKCSAVLTNHKKSVRALCLHPTEYTWASGGADNIKVWKGPDGQFLRNISGHNAIVNTLAINRENVMVSGGDNGSLQFWDWKSGYAFQTTETKAQPGSLDSEAGIFNAVFDHTGTRLITCEADKTIKIWKEDETATEASHPIDFKPEKKRKRY